MAMFKNKSTGAVITANGPVADDYSKRDAWEEVKPATKKAAERQPAKKASAPDKKESEK